MTDVASAARERKLREDVVVSVCFSDFPATEQSFEALRRLAARLDETYRFREIILVASEDERDSNILFVEQVPDVRLFVVRASVSHYERRVVAAEEAIGDIVLLGSAHEMDDLDMLSLIEQAEQKNALVLSSRSVHPPVRTGLSFPIIALGRLARFKVNLNDLESMAIPRTLLNQLLAHREPQLALRFPPRDPRLPIAFNFVDGKRGTKNRISKFPCRVQLLQKLLVYLAPSLLMLVSLFSAILAVLGAGYACYIVGAWILVEHLAPGWLTTSAMLSLTAMFMGMSMLGLSLGLQQLLQRERRFNPEALAEEVNRIDLFGKVATDLNVELEQETNRVERFK